MTRPCNDSFLRALLKEPCPHTPIWLMRQAGRYLPEYCETRRRAGSFLNLCKNPALACEVTLQPLARYPLDAAILFSDILTIPDAMGLGLYFTDGEGPRFERPLREEWAIRDLSAPDPWDHLRYVTDAVTEIRRALNGSVPLIGFAGSPYTLACYMVEGGASNDYRRIKRMLYERPDLLHRILTVTAQAVTAYLNAQIEAGAQAVMIFDSWGGSLSAAAYQEFSLAYMERIVAGLTKEKAGERIPSIVFTKGGGLWLEQIARIGSDAIGLDWTIDIGEARRRVGDRVALQGNLDPGVLFAPPETIAAEARGVLTSYGAGGTGHVFNLGHGISQFTPPESVAALVDAVHMMSRVKAGNDA
ncbi:MAG TPA: uroporphyrinogen decarboxylase [Accumulibacter sp.]|uniref:uroporphyrinogen decarboxylase n=3 Tax=Accumulibacter sp. TaxID=2053492 RepID=UPI002879A3EB|nr:uroporphyrinogen decarboxylase [Accumulibacter sp.]MDS4054554.1 uroporphyrinogen decarboxylase [Accumulibacter sp.]HMV04827.1 uroporphyrinogen decarboxylase [Accumulibacter sp.]HMW80092.1 uroporphyrinogen decarboxylase [Accumulibacter sp.]HNB67824.1 uroporphyrinogen decarboxylase [Accumulibacter sp.]HNC26984.1 uroporphyrinogen decarboxylase [Accumulibacter sp.]